MFHPQLQGPNIIPGLLVLALSIPLGIGAAWMGDGPERPQDELLISHSSLQGAMPCADPERGSNRPVGMAPQPVSRESPSQWWSQVPPAWGMWMSVPSCAMCTPRPGEQLLTSPTALAAAHGPAWQEPLPPGLAVQTPGILEKAISSSSPAAPLTDRNTLQLV